MRILMKWVIAATLICGTAAGLTACDSDNAQKENTDAPMLEGKIVYYDEFSGARLSITEEDMTQAGFTLGDVVSITFEGQEIVAPYYDGYYSPVGDYLLVAYPSYPSICFTASSTGLPEEFMGLEGAPIVVKLKEKGGKIDVQQALSMKYTYNRADYPTDEAFANSRAVRVGRLTIGRLHRTSSPFNNEINRAAYVSTYLEREQVKTVLNLADTEEMILGYDMPPYSHTLWESGNVILCPLKADPTAEDFNRRLIEALKELPQHPAPYVVHCLEGKDRTGYVCALLEGLCGATYEELVADYLKTYENYFFITQEKDPSVCNALVTLRLNMCLKHYAGVTDEAQLHDLDYSSAFSHFLLSHGMTQEQLDALIHALTASNE